MTPPKRKPAPSQTPQIEIAVRVRILPLGRPKIRRIVRMVWNREQGGPAQISIAVIGDRRMAKLTEQYVGRAYRTDVLAFELSDRDDEPFVGEVIVNSQLARQRAAELKIAPAAELALYLIHGLLHLLGHDDGADDDARKMHRRTAAYLKEAGFRIAAQRELDGRDFD